MTNQAIDICLPSFYNTNKQFTALQIRQTISSEATIRSEKSETLRNKTSKCKPQTKQYYKLCKIWARQGKNLPGGSEVRFGSNQVQEIFKIPEPEPEPELNLRFGSAGSGSNLGSELNFGIATSGHP